MISGRFTYATTKVGFGSAFGTSGVTAWQRLKNQRAAMASNLASAQASLAAFTSSLASAQQDKIAGLGTLAAQAAIARVRAEAKAKSDSITAQIDSAQKTIDAANAVKTAKPKFVSWALTQSVDTTA